MVVILLPGETFIHSPVLKLASVYNGLFHLFLRFEIKGCFPYLYLEFTKWRRGYSLSCKGVLIHVSPTLGADKVVVVD